jgi:hypothetical protein
VSGDEDPSIEHFKRVGQVPLAWQMVARELICAANILMARCRRVQGEPLDLERIHTTSGPATLLYGFAVENLIKGLLVAQGVDATSTGVLNAKLKSHDLPYLFREAKVPLGPMDERLLQQLRGIVEAGRYPVPVKVISDPMDPRGWTYLPCNVEHIGQLLELVEDELRTLLGDKILWKVSLLSLCDEKNS